MATYLIVWLVRTKLYMLKLWNLYHSRSQRSQAYGGFWQNFCNLQLALDFYWFQFWKGFSGSPTFSCRWISVVFISGTFRLTKTFSWTENCSRKIANWPKPWLGPKQILCTTVSTNTLTNETYWIRQIILEKSHSFANVQVMKIHFLLVEISSRCWIILWTAGR